MMVSVETVGALERRMKVQVPAERIEKEVDSRLERVGKSAKIKGFRPGKVPMKVVERRFGLHGHPVSTLEEVGREIGVTRERVRQIQKRSIEKLKSIISIHIDELQPLFA
mgnify:CR=1 FL=1